MIADTSGQDEVISSTEKKSKMKLIAIATGVVLLLAFIWPSLSMWYAGVPSVERDKLMVNEVFKGDLIRDVAVNGKLVAANAPQLYSSEAGVIDLLIKPGNQVQQGDVVARIESPELTAELRQQSAELTRLETEARRGDLANQESQLELQGTQDKALVALNAAKREKKRADLSYEKQVISELEWAQVQDAMVEAELLYKHAAEKVKIAKKRLDFEQQNRQNAVATQQIVIQELQRRQDELSIKAPVNGVVGNWLVAQKEKVAKSKALMTIVDLSDYEAELNVPEFYADDLGLGLVVTVQIAGKQLQGEIISVSPEIENSQVKVRAKIAGVQETKPRQNQRLNARIEFESKTNVLMVKRGAFLTNKNGGTAFVISEDNTANQQQIRTGLSSVDYVEVISGLSEGDQIITSSYDDFKDQPVIKLSL